MTAEEFVCYATREDVQQTLQKADSWRMDRHIDRAIQAASRSIEGLLHRRFYPLITTRYFDWPNGSSSLNVLYLDEWELAAAPTSVVSDGVAVPGSDYYFDAEAPYGELTLSWDKSVGFVAGQQTVAITGTFFRLSDDSVGTLSSNVSNSTQLVPVSDGSSYGVGDVLLVDSERMVVVDKQFTASAVDNAVEALDAKASSNNFTVSNGAQFHVGEVLLIDGEYLVINAIAGNRLIVERAARGSALASHSINAPLYVYRVAVVRRGALGTQAVSHLANAAVLRNAPPALVRQATIALAINTIEQGISGYARTVGAGENAREARGTGVNSVLNEAYTRYGRKARMRTI